MSRTVFYCRCGARLEGASARLYHECPEVPVSNPSDAPRPMPTRPELVAAIGRWAEAHKTGKNQSVAGQELTRALDLVYGRVQWLELSHYYVTAELAANATGVTNNV